MEWTNAKCWVYDNYTGLCFPESMSVAWFAVKCSWPRVSRACQIHLCHQTHLDQITTLSHLIALCISGCYNHPGQSYFFFKFRVSSLVMKRWRRLWKNSSALQLTWFLYFSVAGLHVANLNLCISEHKMSIKPPPGAKHLPGRVEQNNNCFHTQLLWSGN